MARSELIFVATPLSVAALQDALAARLGGRWTRPGLGGRVLDTGDGTIAVVSDEVGGDGNLIVFPATEGRDAEQNGYADRVFDALAAIVTGALEMLTEDDDVVRTRSAVHTGA